MQKLNLNIDYKIHNESSQQTSYNLMALGLKSKYPHGINDLRMRIWGSIQKKMDKAIEENSESIELDNSEIMLCKEAIKDGTFDISLAKYVLILEESLNNAQ